MFRCLGSEGGHVFVLAGGVVDVVSVLRRGREFTYLLACLCSLWTAQEQRQEVTGNISTRKQARLMKSRICGSVPPTHIGSKIGFSDFGVPP